MASLVGDSEIQPKVGTVDVLAQAGVIGVQDRVLLADKYPELDPRPEAAIREGLRAVLAGATPDLHRRQSSPFFRRSSGPTWCSTTNAAVFPGAN